MYFGDVVVTTPVIGKSSGLVPAVDVPPSYERT